MDSTYNDGKTNNTTCICSLQAFIGQRYCNEAIPPIRMDAKEFETRKAALEGGGQSTELLEEYYSLDENQTPPVYVLQAALLSEWLISSVYCYWDIQLLIHCNSKYGCRMWSAALVPVPSKDPNFKSIPYIYTSLQAVLYHHWLISASWSVLTTTAPIAIGTNQSVIYCLPFTLVSNWLWESLKSAFEIS